MKKITAEVRQIIRREGWNLLWFQLFYRAVTLPIYLWILNKTLKDTIQAAGYSFLTAENIREYCLRPYTIVSIWLLLAVAAVMMTVEAGGLIGAFQAGVSGKRMNALEMLTEGIRITADEAAKKNWQLFFLILIQAFLSNLLFLYRILMRVRPVNFILEEFFASEGGRLCFCGVLLCLMTAVVPGIFTVHGCMAEHRAFGDSYDKSRQAFGKSWKEILLPVILYQLIVIGAFAVVYEIFVFCAAFLAARYGENGSARIAIMIVRDRVELFWLFLAGMAATSMYYGAVTAGYYRYGAGKRSKGQMEGEYADRPFLERKKMIGAVLVISLVSTAMTWDALRNGLGVADEVLAEIPVTAHRGSSKEAPENTMAAIRQAIEDMAEFVEIDVQMTKDGEIVLSHDKTLKRTAGINRKIQSMTYEELKGLDVGKWFSKEFEGERIPTLREVMEDTKGKIKLNIEMKDEGRGSSLPEKTAALIEEYDMADQCIVSSLSLNYLYRVKEQMPELMAGYIISAAYGDYYSDSAVDFISIRSSLADKKLIERVHEKGKAVHVWTVNSRNELERMKYLQADNIITDFPVRAREALYGQVEEESIWGWMKLLMK